MLLLVGDFFQDLRVFDEAACVYILLWKNNQYYKYII